MIMEWIRGLAPLEEPIGFLWLLDIMAAAFLFWRRKWICAFFLVIIAMVSSIMGNESISRHLIGSLERPYARARFDNLPVADAVVALGGGHHPSAYDLFGFNLNAGANRSLTALELVRQRKGKAIVLGGGTLFSDGRQLETSTLLKAWLLAWGLPDAPVFYLENCTNTRDEALRVSNLAKKQGWQHILLVTSAFHMRRAEAVFSNAGVPVTPVACDFRALGIPKSGFISGPVPRLESLDLFGLYLHEELGWLLYRWYGWIGGGASKSSAKPTTP